MDVAQSITEGNKRTARHPTGPATKPRALETKPRAPRGTGKPRKASKTSGIASAERVMLAKAELIEMELAERRGELIPRAKLLATLQRTYARLKARLRSIPSKIAGQFAPPGKLQQAEAALMAAIDEALDELSDAGDDGKR